nr:polymorphic toxin type 15 domain-containing protein [uncultured Clostridium sp.]
MLGLGNALNKVKSLVPKVVNAGNKAVKTAVKKVADSALGRAVSSIPSTVRAGAAKVGQITRKAVAAIPKIIEPVKKKAVEKAVQIKNTVTAKAVQIKSAVNTAIGQANQAIVNKSNQVIKTVGQIQNAVEKNVNEFNTVTEQKNKRIVEKLKVEWANTSSDLIRGVILAGAFPNYLPIRSSSLLLDFMLKYRRSVIEEYPILEFPVPVLRGPLNFIRNEITNKGAAAGSFIYKQKIPGLSDFVGELTDQRGPGAESNAFSVVGAGVRGVVVKGALGMVDGFASLIDDPVTALEGLNSIVAHPDETIPVMCEGAKTFWNEKVVNGSPEDRAEVVGQAVFEVATWLVGVGEAKTGATLGKTAKVARGTETIEDLSKANKVLKSYRFADGVDAATDTLKIAKSAETVIGKTTSKINKSWLKNLGKTAAKNLDDAIIKTSKKTGDFIDNIRWGMKQHSNGPKLAFETVGNIDSLSSTGDMIADYFSRIKKIVKNKLDSTGNHNVNIKPKVDAEDVSKSIKKSGTGPGTFAEGAGDVRKLDEIEVKFKQNPKHDSDEFTRQLKAQEDGMNQLTVDEYLTNRDRYLAEGRALEGNAAQQAAREQALTDKIEELVDSGKSIEDATKQANDWMNSQAALHNPDQIAGGNPLNVSGMGDKGINSSLGSQWKYRIDDVDAQIRKAAEMMTEAERQSTHLNIKFTQ